MRPAPPQMPHAEGRRSAVTPPSGSSSTTGLTTNFTGRQDTSDTGNEYVDPKSVICVGEQQMVSVHFHSREP